MPTEAWCGRVRQVSARPVYQARGVFLSKSQRSKPLGLRAVERALGSLLSPKAQGSRRVRYQTLSHNEMIVALISTARSGGLHFHRRLVTRAPERPNIRNGDVWVLRWRRSIVEVLVVAATLALAFAATDTSGHVPLLLVAGVLVGASLILEPKVTVPRAAADIGPQLLQPPLAHA